MLGQREGATDGPMTVRWTCRGPDLEGGVEGSSVSDTCASDSGPRPAVREGLTHVGGPVNRLLWHLSACVYVAWAVVLSGGLWPRAGSVAVKCLLLGV